MKIYLMCLLLATAAMAKKYDINVSDSKIGFEIFKFKINGPVNGEFKEYEGSFDYDEQTKILKEVKAKIKAISVDTQEPKRDKHLRSADFFDVDKYKTIKFESTQEVILDEKGEGKLKGKFTLHGITKEVELNIKLKDKKQIMFEAKTKIDRSDYGIKWNKTFKLEDLAKKVLGDEVKIELKIAAKK